MPKDIGVNQAAEYQALRRFAKHQIISKDDDGKWFRLSDNPVQDYYQRLDDNLHRPRPNRLLKKKGRGRQPVVVREGRELATVAKKKSPPKFTGFVAAVEEVTKLHQGAGGVVPFKDGMDVIVHDGRLFTGTELAVIPMAVLKAMMDRLAELGERRLTRLESK